MTPRLSALWFAYFAGLGIFFPFYSLYLRQDLALDGTRVGLVMSVIPLVGLFAQPLWGQLADRTGSRRRVLAIVIFGVAVANLLLGFLPTFASVLVGTAALALFSTSVVSMATAVSLAAQGEKGGASFGFVRLWGTLGFLVSVVLFPSLLEALRTTFDGPWSGLGWMFPAVAMASLLAVPFALSLPPNRSLTVRSTKGDTRKLLRHPPIQRLLIMVLLAHTCVQGPINLFPLLVTSRGGDLESLSKMWIFMLLLEIPLIGFSGPTLRKLGPRGLLTLGLLAEGIRWSVTAFATDLSIIRMAQLLHGVGVAGIIIGAPLYLELAVPERLRSTGQGLIASVGFGLGAIVSTAGAGWLFDHLGVGAPYGIAGGGTLVLALLVHRLLPEPYRPGEKPRSEEPSREPGPPEEGGMGETTG